jgi:hypothetical protein
MQYEGKLNIKYLYDENYSTLWVNIKPHKRGATVVEVTNALLSALAVQLSDSLHIPQEELLETIVNAVKEKVNVRITQGSQDQVSQSPADESRS